MVQLNGLTALTKLTSWANCHHGHWHEKGLDHSEGIS